MTEAALVLWIMTALGGLSMAGIWLVHGGPAQHRAGVSRISRTRLGSHFGLAATGLVLWIIHVASDSTVAGWVAVGLLPIVATIGVLMFMTSLAGRGAARTDERPAEQRFPLLIVVAHGTFAVLTVLAVVVSLLI